MELVEHIDANKVELLLKQPSEKIDKPTKGILGIIRKMSLSAPDDDTYHLTVKYEHTEYLQKIGIGRVYHKSVSVLKLPKPVRQFLLCDTHINLDIKNCHYSLSLDLARKWDLPHTAIKTYVEDREQIIQKTMKDFNMSHKEAKKLYLSIAYGNKWVQGDEFTKTLGEEMLVLAGNVYEKCKEWHNVKFKKDANALYEHSNRIYSTLSYYLQTEELKAMQLAIDFLRQNSVQVDVYLFDGLYVNKSQYRTELNVKLSEYIREHTGYTLEFESKTIQSTFEPKPDKKEKEYDGLCITKFALEHFMILGKLFYEHEDNARKAEPIENPGPYCEEFGDKYWKHVQRNLPSNRRYKYFDFMPYNMFTNYYDPKAYNYFKGFKFEEYFPELNAIQKTDWLGYCNQIRSSVTADDYAIWKQSMTYKQLSQYLCAGNPASLKYVMQYLAKIIFHPHYRIGKMMIFRNNRGGTGKTSFFHKLYIQGVLGKQYGGTHSSLNEVFGEKNMNMQNKLLLILEESEVAQTKGLQGQIKEAVDRDETHLRMLYHNPNPVKNTCNFILNTNKEIGIVFEKDNMRRFPVFDVREHRLDEEEIEQLTNETGNPDFVKVFVKVLLNEYDSKFNFNVFPKSETCETLAEKCADPVEQFIKFIFVEWNDYAVDSYDLFFIGKCKWHNGAPFELAIDQIYDIYKLFSNKRLPSRKVLEYNSFTHSERWIKFKTQYKDHITIKHSKYEIDYKKVRTLMTDGANLHGHFSTDTIVSSSKRARTKE